MPADESTETSGRGHCPKRRWGWGVAVAVFVCISLRLGWAVGADVDVREVFRFDPSMYDFFARQMAGGRGMTGYSGAPTAHFPPGYPLILAASYRLFGPNLIVAWVLNALFSGATCVLIYAIGGALLLSRSTSLVASFMFALCPGDILYSGLPLSEPLFGSVFTLAIWVFTRLTMSRERVRMRSWLYFGVLLGAVTLVRGVGVFFLAVPGVIWLLLDGPRQSSARGSLAAAGLLLSLVPWMARNYWVMGYPMLSADGPIAFFSGHNPLAFGGQSFEMRTLREREWPDIYRLGFPEQEVEQYKADVRYGVRYMLTHPCHEVSLVPRRVYEMYKHDHDGLILSRSPRGKRALKAGGKLFRPVLDRVIARAADGYFFGLIVLSLVGVPRMLGRGEPVVLVLPLTVACLTLTQAVLFFGMPRYHAPLVPVLCLMAAGVIGQPRRSAPPMTVRRLG